MFCRGSSCWSLQGPVLSARQALVAKKLEEEAGEQKDKKDTKKEKKEVLLLSTCIFAAILNLYAFEIPTEAAILFP